MLLMLGRSLRSKLLELRCKKLSFVLLLSLLSVSFLISIKYSSKVYQVVSYRELLLRKGVSRASS